MNKLKLVKAIVFILTFLLVFGLLSVVGIIYRKASQPAAKSDISLNQPAGSSVADYRIDDNNLYILLKGGKTADRIVIVDKKTGAFATVKTY